jgi:hypothetical protein
MLVGLRHLGKYWGNLAGMENRRQLPQYEGITPGLLYGHGFVEQVSLAQVRQDEIQEMDMTDT